jgi:hypothetical protein
VDIEQNTLVKLGTHISADEGEAAQFVARSIGHPLPRIYATLHDEAAGGHLHRAGEAVRRAPDDSFPDARCYHPCQSRMRDERHTPHELTKPTKLMPWAILGSLQSTTIASCTILDARHHWVTPNLRDKHPRGLPPLASIPAQSRSQYGEATLSFGNL